MAFEKKIRAGLVGVTGYTGMELVRLLHSHPVIELAAATSRAEAGKKLSDIYPFMLGLKPGEVVLIEPDPTILSELCDVIFLAIPHGAAMDMGAEMVRRGCKVVDLSADYRLRDASVYEAWYKVDHTQKSLLTKAVYGLPEIYSAEAAKADLVANPGCYPSSAILGLYPAIKHKFISIENIIIDSKSGTSGAGRGANVGALYCEVADTFRPYNLGVHRHTPEIEQELSRIANSPITVSFNPHLLPINRGILSTIYATLNPGVTLDQVHEAYTSDYQQHRFVRILPRPRLPELRSVRGTMFCDIALVHDQRTNRLIIISAIDNLCRGASGQALANANLMLGLPLETGLDLPPLVP